MVDGHDKFSIAHNSAVPRADTTMSSPHALEAVLAQLKAQGVALPAGRVRLDCYGDSPAQSRSLLALIRRGRKRAGTSLLWAHEAEQEPLPEAGDIEVVLDHRMHPALISRVVEVSVLAFDQVTGAYAAIEGEGDGSLAYWRQVHWDYFARECQRLGRTPAPDMRVVCSVFELVQVLRQRG
jgi:uncharacterized protein YhfF